MTTPDKEFSLELSRRKLLAAAGIGGSVVLAPYLVGTTGAADQSLRRIAYLIACF
jgi:hypothetical protein